MIKKLGFTAVALSALILSGCGGGGSSHDEMNDKKYILIFTEVPSGICEDASFRNELSTRMGGLLTRETDNTSSCETYDKHNDGNECVMEYQGGGNRNCVIGFNTLDGQGKQTKTIGDTELYNIAETVAGKLNK